MKILHVVPTFYPATYFGGPIFSLYGLCNALSHVSGVELRVLTTDSSGPGTEDRLEISSFPTVSAEGYEIYYCRKIRGAEFSLQMLIKMRAMINWADVIHLTGVYSPPTIPTLLLCKLLGKPVMWSPRGSLQRWEGTTRSVAKKIWELICNPLCDNSRTLLHVTSTEEQYDSSLRITQARAVVIPNGIEVPTTVPSRIWQPNGVLRLLFLGRLHPIKGIENLLKAMALLKSNVRLNICGDGDATYRKKLENLVANEGLRDRVSFLGEVTGLKKAECFFEADVCILPSFSENFGMVVVEALAHGLPVIASKGSPWSEMTTKGCGMLVDNQPESLVSAIEEIGLCDLAAMGANGRMWMQESFAWESIAQKIYAQYQTLREI